MKSSSREIETDLASWWDAAQLVERAAHFALGPLRAVDRVRLADIHTRHHLALIDDIRAAP
jgi:hypothetical protein